MGRPQLLTRDYLERLGVVKITEDGNVYLCDKTGGVYLANIGLSEKKSRFGIQKYHHFSIYDPDIYQANKNKYPSAGMKKVILSRAMYAWFYNEAPAGMDVDHINGDSLDDRIENLQLLTRKENLAKRKGNINQYGLRLKERN